MSRLTPFPGGEGMGRRSIIPTGILAGSLSDRTDVRACERGVWE